MSTSRKTLLIIGISLLLFFGGFFGLLRFETKSMVFSNLSSFQAGVQVRRTGRLQQAFEASKTFNAMSLALVNPEPQDIRYKLILRADRDGPVLFQNTIIVNKNTYGFVEVGLPDVEPTPGRLFLLDVNSEEKPVYFFAANRPFENASFKTYTDDRKQPDAFMFELFYRRTTPLLGFLATRTASQDRFGIALLVLFALVSAALAGFFLSKSRAAGTARPDSAPHAGDGLKRRLVLFFVALFIFSSVSISFLAPNNTHAKLLGSEDDAFITYKYARNIAEGNGFRFNADEKCLGTTTPLYTMVLAFLGLFSKNFPVLSLLLNFLSILLAAMIVESFLAEIVPPLAALAGGVQFLFFPLFYRVLGMETNFLILLIIAGLHAFHRKKYPWSFFVLGLATLTRIESCLLLPLFGLVMLLRKESLKLLQSLGVYLATIVPWFAFSFFYFGQLLPNTFYIKSVAGYPGADTYQTIGRLFQSLVRGKFLTSFFLSGFTDYLPSNIQNYLLWMIVFVLAAFLAAKAIIDNAFIRLYILWAVVYVLAFSLLNTWRFVWYYVLALSIIPILIPPGIETVRRFVRKIAGERPALGIAVLLAGFPVVLGGMNIHEFFFGHWYQKNILVLERYETYRSASRYINLAIPPDQSIALEEIGILGYSTDRKIWDLYGLIHESSRFPFLFPAESVSRIPYLLTLMDPDYLLVVSWRMNNHIPLLNYQRIRDFPVAQYAPRVPAYYSLLKRMDDRMIVAGHSNLSGTYSGRAAMSGWCFGTEEIRSVEIRHDGEVIAVSGGLGESPPDIKDSFSRNPFSARAVFHVDLDTARMGNGTQMIEFWAIGGKKTGIFWKGLIEIRN